MVVVVAAVIVVVALVMVVVVMVMTGARFSVFLRFAIPLALYGVGTLERSPERLTGP